MMLTTKSRYAVMAILAVAEVQSKNRIPVSLTSIARNQKIPLNYLEQIFLKLKNANIVTSIKGPGGGYLLNTDCKDIYIVSIIDAVDENLKMTRCSTDKDCRQNGVKCKTHDLWKGLSKQIRDYFSAFSVHDVLLGIDHVNRVDHNHVMEEVS